MKINKRRIVFVFIIIGAVYFYINSFFNGIQGIKGQQYLNDLSSPNGEYTVKAYLNNGGATVDYAVLVQLKNNKNNKTKNIYWNYHCDKAEMKWIDNKVIRINNVELNVENEIYDYRNSRE